VDGTPQKHRLAEPTLRDTEAVGSPSNLDVDQNLLISSAGGPGQLDVPHPDFPVPDMSLAEVHLYEVPLPDVPIPKPGSYGVVRDEWTLRRIAWCNGTAVRDVSRAG
jgi:hypothetical protein